MSGVSALQRVLVVDDEDSLRHLLVLALESQGIEVDCASDGVEALERYQTDRHDAVLTDIRMPRLDGLAFTRKLLQAHPDAVVVVMSAYGDIDVAMEALEAGAVDYLNKPFQPDEVKLRLMIAIERWRLGAENLRLRAVVEKSSSFEHVANASPAMKRITQTLESAWRRIDRRSYSAANRGQVKRSSPAPFTQPVTVARAVCGGQLWRHPRQPPRVRVLRPQTRRVRRRGA